MKFEELKQSIKTMGREELKATEIEIHGSLLEQKYKRILLDEVDKRFKIVCHDANVEMSEIKEGEYYD